MLPFKALVSFLDECPSDSESQENGAWAERAPGALGARARPPQTATVVFGQCFLIDLLRAACSISAWVLKAHSPVPGASHMDGPVGLQRRSSAHGTCSG